MAFDRKQCRDFSTEQWWLCHEGLRFLTLQFWASVLGEGQGVEKLNYLQEEHSSYSLYSRASAVFQVLFKILLRMHLVFLASIFKDIEDDMYASM